MVLTSVGVQEIRSSYFPWYINYLNFIVMGKHSGWNQMIVDKKNSMWKAFFYLSLDQKYVWFCQTGCSLRILWLAITSAWRNCSGNFLLEHIFSLGTSFPWTMTNWAIGFVMQLLDDEKIVLRTFCNIPIFELRMSGWKRMSRLQNYDLLEIYGLFFFSAQSKTFHVFLLSFIRVFSLG